MKGLRVEYTTYIFRENKQNFAFTAQFPSRWGQTSTVAYAENFHGDISCRGIGSHL